MARRRRPRSEEIKPPRSSVKKKPAVAGTDDPTIPVRGTTDHSRVEGGERPPPVKLRAIDFQGGSPTSDTPLVSASWPPISVVPTVYPQDPGGAIVGGQNHVTINLNIHGSDFSKFKGTIVDLREALRGANAIGPEVRQQLIAETSAGVELLEAPKTDRGWIDLLLIRPLTWLSTMAEAGERITQLALVALDLLKKMMG